MTREEAIEILQGAIKKPNTKDGYLGQAIDMAIKALSAEPCEDAISRQAVLDINASHHGQMPNHINHQIWNEIKSLPSVQPVRSKGEWMSVLPDYYHCSLCKKEHCFKTNFCPNCGADMRGEE